MDTVEYRDNMSRWRASTPLLSNTYIPRKGDYVDLGDSINWVVFKIVYYLERNEIEVGITTL